MSLASLTSPPVAAYLCPDSVLVAEDGTVLFGLPPANGGYAAGLTLGAAFQHCQMVGREESSAGLCAFLS